MLTVRYLPPEPTWRDAFTEKGLLKGLGLWLITMACLAALMAPTTDRDRFHLHVIDGIEVYSPILNDDRCAADADAGEELCLVGTRPVVGQLG